MTITAPNPLAPVSPPDETALAFRLNQRISAEVIQVAGEKVALSVQGVAVVARLTSAEQAAALVERRMAQFIVRDLSGQTITLQLINHPAPPGAAAPAQAPDLAATLLQQAGIPAHPQNVLLAQLALNRGLPLTGALLAGLQQALAALGNWDLSEAQMAVALKAYGLPLSGGALELALSARPESAQALVQLLAQLRALINQPAALPGDLLRQVKTAISVLESGIVPADLPPAVQAGKLQQAAAAMGQSLEHQVASLIQSGIKGSEEGVTSGLLALAKLYASLSQSGYGPLAEPINRFLESMRWSHLLNSPPEHASGHGHWISLNFPLQAAGARPAGDNLAQVRLRVARNPDPDPKAQPVNPRYTRLVIEVETGHGETLQADLSIVERRIGARITASSKELCELAQTELPFLAERLANLGLHLHTSQFEVGPPAETGPFAPPATEKFYSAAIDLSA